MAALLSLTACGAARQPRPTTPAVHPAGGAATADRVALTSCFVNPAGVGSEAVITFPAPSNHGMATWRADVGFGTHVVKVNNATGAVAHAASYFDSAGGAALPCRVLDAATRVNGAWQKVQGRGLAQQPAGG